jgi:molybdate transport system substrate-binding protein
MAADNVKADDLFMYCGAGLRQPVDEILSAYMKKTGEKVVVEFGGSGQLLTRYRGSGWGDLFLPGSHFYTDQLDTDRKIEKSYSLVLHVPVVAVNRNSEDIVKCFNDLTKTGVRVGLGDHRAMALGRTAAEILEKSGLKDAILKNTIVHAATVKQLTLYAAMGNVDAAIIARADAFQNKDNLVFFDINREWYKPEVVTVAVLNTSKKIDRAKRVAEYFSRPDSIKIFIKYGFLPVD